MAEAAAAAPSDSSAAAAAAAAPALPAAANAAAGGKKSAYSIQPVLSSPKALEIPPAIATKEELAAVPAMRASVLKALKVDTPPKDLAQYFTTGALLRFLRARRLDIEKSTVLIVEAMEWYRKFDVPGKIKTWAEEEQFTETGQTIRKWMPVGLHGKDKRGVGVLYGRYGLIDFKGLCDKVGIEPVAMQWVYNEESELRSIDEASEIANKHFVNTTVVLDMAHMKFRRTLAALGPFKTLVQISDDYYPERLNVCFIVNCPWAFKVIYQMASMFLSADTKAKVQLFTKSEDYMTPMTKVIDKDQIPQFLGGTNKTPWEYGAGGDVISADDKALTQLRVSTLETIQMKLEPGETCVWRWFVHSHDIDFFVDAKCGETTTSVAGKTRHGADAGEQSGTFTAPADAAGMTIVTLTFDNSFSYVRKKEVSYEIINLVKEPAAGAEKEEEKSDS